MVMFTIIPPARESYIYSFGRLSKYTNIPIVNSSGAINIIVYIMDAKKELPTLMEKIYLNDTANNSTNKIVFIVPLKFK